MGGTTSSGGHDSSAGLFLEMAGSRRYVYESADLFEQLRRDPGSFVERLQCPVTGAADLEVNGPSLVSPSSGCSYPIRNRVVDFRADKRSAFWSEQNEAFLRYHRSLTPVTMLNSAPIINYVSSRTGLAHLENASVLDVGGGTGHTLCSFFRHPHELEYFLYDPNERLLHDQFLRVYPALAEIELAHVLGYAETMPFVDASFDLVMSFSSVDHFESVPAFLSSARRVLKPSGTLLVSSHLDPEHGTGGPGQVMHRLSQFRRPEHVLQSAYYRSKRIPEDDHTQHFETVTPMVDAATEAGFRVTQAEEFAGHFLVVARPI